jgi:AbrB family looped-hinge helix DNA binding protein
MALVKVLRSGQVTLPTAVRKKLRVKEGDYLEAEVVEGGVLLKPVGLIARDKSWSRVFAAMGRVRPTPEQAPKSLEEQEKEIYEIVEDFRHRHD